MFFKKELIVFSTILIFIQCLSERVYAQTLIFTANELRNMLGANINWVDDGDGLGLHNGSSFENRIDSLVHNLGYNYLRIPGGYLARTFKWQSAVGENRGHETNFEGKRELVLTGLKEMKNFAHRNHLRVLYTININDTPESIRELIDAWKASEPREEAPIEYIELGNEVYDIDPTTIGAINYCQTVAPLIDAVRLADNSIKIGAIVTNPQRMEWDTVIIQKLGAKIDFISWHRYVPYCDYEDIDSYEKTLNSFHDFEAELIALKGILKAYYLPIILTEFNLSYNRGDVHQNVNLSVRHNMAFSNFYYYALKHNISGMYKHTLSSIGWHTYADINFSRKQEPIISVGGMITSLIQGWLRDQDSLALWQTSQPEEEFSIVIGKKGKNAISLLIQNHRKDVGTVNFPLLVNRSIDSYQAYYQRPGGTDMWIDSRGENMIDTKEIRVYPFSTTIIKYRD